MMHSRLINIYILYYFCIIVSTINALLSYSCPVFTYTHAHFSFSTENNIISYFFLPDILYYDSILLKLLLLLLLI